MPTKNLTTNIVNTVLVREQGLCTIKTDCSVKMVVAFTNKEINYLMVSVTAISVSYRRMGVFEASLPQD